MGQIPQLAELLENARRNGYNRGQALARRTPAKAAARIPELADDVIRSGIETHTGAGALGQAEGILANLHAATRCRICGRELSDPLSVKRGIGPDCIAKLRREAEQEARFREAMAVLGQDSGLDVIELEEDEVQVTATREEAPTVIYELEKGSYRARRIDVGEPGARVLELNIEPGAVYPKSPDGHSYGYNGSGPNQLALDVLTDWMGRQPEPTVRLAFVRRFISGVDGPIWRVSGAEIEAFLDEMLQEAVADA